VADDKTKTAKRSIFHNKFFQLIRAQQYSHLSLQRSRLKLSRIESSALRVRHWLVPTHARLAQHTSVVTLPRLAVPLKFTKVAFFTIILYNSENNICDRAIFFVHCLSQQCCEVFFTSLTVAKTLPAWYYQILLKSPPPTLLGGSALGQYTWMDILCTRRP